ncbi:PaaX family transcriptional regulator C-terminal domain-containing protein [Glutamicibacter nicotianae]|uniref:PaaX family transcriptional regulator n=1 Tax=Glutamicibacter nicotianae TaxID=37929 RepID=UPI000EF90DB1|nr:PaaX family transcriptional regulator C-terminal domain-containing protein [Glutamicibacter nicotianae]
MTPKPRSLIMDLFGDYLRYNNGEARLGELTELLSAFDIEPSSARMTLSRLKKQGWFETRREGRETIYTLTESMLQVLAEGRERIFQRRDSPWDGRWTMVLYQVPETERAVRESLRKNLSWLGFGQLSSSSWLAAHDLMREANELAELYPQASVDTMWTSTDSTAKDKSLALRCWDLEELAGDYREFIDKYAPVEQSRDFERATGAAALVMRTTLVADARRFTFRDPRLPLELQPRDWPGREAYELFRRLHAYLGPAARAYVESIIKSSLSTYPPH